MEDVITVVVVNNISNSVKSQFVIIAVVRQFLLGSDEVVFAYKLPCGEEGL